MKTKILPLLGGLAIGLCVLSVNAWAGPVETIEVSYAKFGTPSTISISTSAWVKVPATSTLSKRAGLIVDAPASNTANVVGHLAGCTSTAIAISVRPIEIIKGESYTFLPIDNSTCLWLLSLHTAAESVHVQEVGQRN